MTLAGDFLGPPYGLLLLAAQAIRAGHLVTTLNLSNFAWSDVKGATRGLEADIFGITCFTANRRGAAYVVDEIRRYHRGAHIVVGGPHVSALPRETLERQQAIDTVVIGEGEETLLELCERLERGESLQGIPGTAWREGGEVRVGPPRPPLRMLDRLASLHDEFETPFVVTSRGCPGRCIFCGSHAMWGRGVRLHSAEYVLDTLETIVRRHHHPLVAFKDDTFTAQRRRTLEICRGIESRKLNFLWFCDTRADALVAGGEELVVAMRRAGCLQISLGVESGSPEILDRLHKRIDVDHVRRATKLSKSVGMRVRYYLILGSPGESLATLEETFSLVREEMPHQVVFTPFSTYPGTDECQRLVDEGRLSTDAYFEDDFWTPTFFNDIDSVTQDHLRRLLEELPGIGTVCRPTVEDCRASVVQVPSGAANHMDLALALLDAKEDDEAEAEVARALELGYPLTGVGENALACVAARRGDAEAVRAHLEAAVEGYPLRHASENLDRFRSWKECPSEELSELVLEVHPYIEIAEEMVQPLNPGPITVSGVRGECYDGSRR